MTPRVLEGTWEEIVRQSDQLAGKRVRVTILADDGNSEAATRRPEGQMFFGMFRGEREPTEDDFRSAEFRGDPDDGLNWQ